MVRDAFVYAWIREKVGLLTQIILHQYPSLIGSLLEAIKIEMEMDPIMVASKRLRPVHAESAPPH
jgi:hypothetical protein